MYCARFDKELQLDNPFPNLFPMHFLCCMYSYVLLKVFVDWSKQTELLSLKSKVFVTRILSFMCNFYCDFYI